MNGIKSIISTFFSLLNLLIIIRVVISWIRPNISDPNWRKVLRFIFNVTEPILGPIRRLIPTGSLGIDISPLIAIFALNIIRNFVLSII